MKIAVWFLLVFEGWGLLLGCGNFLMLPGSALFRTMGVLLQWCLGLTCAMAAGAILLRPCGASGLWARRLPATLPKALFAFAVCFFVFLVVNLLRP